MVGSLKLYLEVKRKYLIKERSSWSDETGEIRLRKTSIEEIVDHDWISDWYRFYYFSLKYKF